MSAPKLSLWKKISRRFWSCLPKKTRINHSLRSLQRSFSIDIKEARRKGEWQKARDLEEQEWIETSGYFGQLELLDTNYWQRRARRFHIPVPERNGTEDKNWKFIEDREDSHKYWHLTDAAKFEIYRLIREERKHRREGRLAYITASAQILAALTGIGGVIIGILAASTRGK
jgi:hypothetical protein